MTRSFDKVRPLPYKMAVFNTFLFSGDIIYVRVMVDPVQNLGDSFYCSIEKVFLCTGADGYVPKYNPPDTEYGCLADSPSLLYRFKIVVRLFVLIRSMCYVFSCFTELVY